MVTVEEWSRIMEDYGAKIWPMQIVFYIVAILLTVWLCIKPGRIQNILMKLYLCIAFTWIGIAFYFIIAKDIAGNTYGNYIIGVFFIIIAVLFAVDLFRNKMQFSLPTLLLPGRRTYDRLSNLLLQVWYRTISKPVCTAR
jgi:hypothetical protein